MAAVYFSIGSNGADAVAAVARAIGQVLAIPGAREIGRGRLYHTEPMGVTDQPWFVNTALAVELALGPRDILRRIKRIEAKLGRKPGGERWGPREIDIDVIFYGDTIMTTDELTIPHPMAAGRRFVLAPLADIDPGLLHPILGKTVRELLAALPGEGQALRPITP
jgi:2-amino-4-hydroxy-6-hydroxymethyldihydropteridine diphosphokinase